MPRTAVVTGASTGIGAGVAKRLIEDGWHVVMMARSKDKMQQIVTKEHLNHVLIIPVDITNTNDTINAAKKANQWSIFCVFFFLFFVRI